MKMKVPGAPPLKFVVDDGSHEAAHMAQTVLFWLPRIEPGGILFVEDVQPTGVANPWATQFLPQIMKDLHYCGDKDKPTEDEACFPTLVGMIQSIHCEMHICAFERNQAPAKELSLEESSLPANALDMKNANPCYLDTGEYNFCVILYILSRIEMRAFRNREVRYAWPLSNRVQRKILNPAYK